MRGRARRGLVNLRFDGFSGSTPAYILSFAILLCFPPLVPADAARADPIWQVFSHALLVHNLDLRTLSGVNPVFWSIAVEAQLYLIYPLLLMAVRRWGWPVALTGCAVVELGIRAMQSHLGHANPDTMNEALPGWVGSSPLAFWFSWSIGAWVADAWLRKKPLQVGAPVVAGALVAALVAFHFAWTVPFSFTAFAVAAAAFCAWALNRPETLARSASSRWLGRHLSFAGKVSYSFYLLHNPLLFLWIAILAKYWPGEEHLGLVRFGACLAIYPAILFISYLFYRYVELPSIAWGQGVLKRTRAVPAAG